MLGECCLLSTPSRHPRKSVCRGLHRHRRQGTTNPDAQTRRCAGADRMLHESDRRRDRIRGGQRMNKRKVLIGVAVVLVAVVMVFVFSRSKSKGTAQAAAPVEVEVAQVEQKDVPIYSEWIGTLDGLVNAEIKSQVTGYLLSKNYTEGSFVKKGQLLFAIDPRPLQAALEQARGELAKANGQVAQ